jgi:hypothetical protein
MVFLMQLLDLNCLKRGCNARLLFGLQKLIFEWAWVD